MCWSQQSSERCSQTLLTKTYHLVVGVRHQYFPRLLTRLERLQVPERASVLTHSGGSVEAGPNAAAWSSLRDRCTWSSFWRNRSKAGIFVQRLVSTPWRCLCIPQIEVSTRERLRTAKSPSYSVGVPRAPPGVQTTWSRVPSRIADSMDPKIQALLILC